MQKQFENLTEQDIKQFLNTQSITAKQSQDGVWHVYRSGIQGVLVEIMQLSKFQAFTKQDKEWGLNDNETKKWQAFLIVNVAGYGKQLKNWLLKNYFQSNVWTVENQGIRTNKLNQEVLLHRQRARQKDQSDYSL